MSVQEHYLVDNSIYGYALFVKFKQVDLLVQTDIVKKIEGWTSVKVYFEHEI